MKNSINKNNNTKLKEILIIVGTFLLVFIIIGYTYYASYNHDYDSIKKDNSKYIVYTKYEENNNYSKYIPTINIDSEIANQANEDIDNYLLKYMNIEKSFITYEYNISGDLLSLVLKVSDYQDEYEPKIYFKSYIINLDTLSLVSNHELLSLYEMDEGTVERVIESYFNKYYLDLVKKGYYNQDECNYECFLKYRDVNNYLDNVNYYVENGNLIVYKPFIFYSIFGDEDYFKEKHFKFKITDY